MNKREEFFFFDLLFLNLVFLIHPLYGSRTLDALSDRLILNSWIKGKPRKRFNVLFLFNKTQRRRQQQQHSTAKETEEEFPSERNKKPQNCQ